MKVLHILPDLKIGGMERLVLELAKITASQHKVGILCYDHHPHAIHFSGQPSDNNIEIKYLEKPPRFSIRVILQTLKVLTDEDWSMVHTHDTGSLFYFTLVKVLRFFTSSKKMLHLHTQHTLSHINEPNRKWLYDRMFAPWADKVTAVNLNIYEYYKKIGVKESKLLLVPNGVPFCKNTPLQRDEKMRLRSEILTNVSQSQRMEKKWWLNCARLHPLKGQKELLLLWSKTSQRFKSNNILFLVGPTSDENYFTELKTFCEEHKLTEGIIFIGPTQIPAKWMKASDFYISGSQVEGSPLAPMEALCSALPTYLSEIYGHKDFAGYVHFFSSENLNQETISKIEQQAELPINNSLLGEIREKFGLTKMAQTYLDIYNVEMRKS